MGKLKLRRWTLEGWVWVLLLLRSWGFFCYIIFLTNEIFFFLGLERVLSENPEVIWAKLRCHWQTLMGEGTGWCRDKVQQLMGCCCARWVLAAPQCQSGWTFWSHGSGHLEHPPLCITLLECRHSYKFTPRSAGMKHKLVIMGLGLLSGFCDKHLQEFSGVFLVFYFGLVLVFIWEGTGGYFSEQEDLLWGNSLSFASLQCEKVVL